MHIKTHLGNVLYPSSLKTALSTQSQESLRIACHFRNASLFLYHPFSHCRFLTTIRTPVDFWLSIYDDDNQKLLCSIYSSNFYQFIFFMRVIQSWIFCLSISGFSFTCQVYKVYFTYLDFQTKWNSLRRWKRYRHRVLS